MLNINMFLQLPEVYYLLHDCPKPGEDATVAHLYPHLFFYSTIFEKQQALQPNKVADMSLDF